MSLSWKDAVATILTGGVGLVMYAKLKGFDWPMLGSWRVATLVVFTLGIATCIAVSGDTIPAKNAWMTLASVLGGLAFVLLLIGLFMNSKLIFVALCVDIFILWVVSTLHHTLTAGS